MRRKVAFAKAKKRVMKDLGQAKGNNQTWFEYFEMVSLKKLGHVNLANPRVKIILQNMAFPLNQFVHDIPLGESAFNIYQFDV